jgi:hypothetical protein
MNNHLDRSYVLLNNVDCIGVAFNPIGTSVNPFTGSFNGNGYTISNLNIYVPNTSGAALFGMTKNAIINNVILKNVYVFSTGNLPS